MKNIDFIFTFEHKARELDNICLLSYELQRRGYSTDIINIRDSVRANKNLFKATVGVVPAAYDNKSLFYSFADSIEVDKVVNMQWEQVFSVHQEKDLQSRRNITDIARDVVHLSWGKRNRDRLVGVCEINPDKVKITGHIAMDFLRPEFSSFYKTRIELFEEYNIPLDNKVCVFLSSFTSTGALKEEIDKAARTLGTQIYDRRIVSIKTQKEILRWIKKFLEKHPEISFVYRPHPAERDNEEIERMVQELSNFYVIRDYSVKQWIITADILYTWCSTSIVEAFFAGKVCHVLRPLNLPADLDMMIYQGGHFVESYDQFSKSVFDSSCEFPLSKDLIYQYYSKTTEKPIYMKIADVLEDVYQDKNYDLTEEQKREIPYGLSADGELKLVRKIKNIVKKTFLSNWYYSIMLSERDYKFFPEKLRRKKAHYRILEEDNKRKNATKNEINLILQKISNLNLGT